MNVQNFTAIHQIVVEIFLSEPKWWTEKQTDITKQSHESKQQETNRLFFVVKMTHLYVNYM